MKLNIRNAILGMGVGAVWLVAASGAAAGLMVRGLVGLGTMNYWAAVILVTTGFAGAFAAMAGGGSIYDGLISGAGGLVVLLTLNGALNGGQMEGLPMSILTLAGGCGGAVFLRLRPGKERRRRRRIGKLHKNRGR